MRMTNEEINKYVDMGDIEKDEEITTERAIAEVYRWVSVVEHESYEYENLTPKVLDMAIKALSAEKTAEWRIVGKTTLHYECSKCGGAGDKWDKFCKHCGRRMGVEEC